MSLRDIRPAPRELAGVQLAAIVFSLAAISAALLGVRWSIDALCDAVQALAPVEQPAPIQEPPATGHYGGKIR